MRNELRLRGAAFAAVLLLSGCGGGDDAPARSEPLDVTVQALLNTQPVEAVLTATEKRSGSPVWTGTFAIGPSPTTVRLGNLGTTVALTFTSGQVTKSVTLDLVQFRFNPELIIGLTEDDYYRHATTDGKLVVRVMKDPTNPYFEVNVAVPETQVDYAYITRLFWLDGNPVDDELYREIKGSFVDNVTFRAFRKYRGKYGQTWDFADGMIEFQAGEDYHEIYHSW